MASVALAPDGTTYVGTDGRRYDRVTTVLGTIADGDGLIYAGAQWAAAASWGVVRAAVAGEPFARPSVYEGMPCTIAQDVATWPEKDYTQWVRGRVAAERQRAMDRGNTLDAVSVALCEGHVTSVDDAADFADSFVSDGLLTCDTHEARSVGAALAGWWLHHNVEPVKWQQSVHDDEAMVAGTFDLLAVIKGQLWLLDFKAGQFRATHPMQVGTYCSMLPGGQDVHMATRTAIVSVLPRTNGEGHYVQFRTVEYPREWRRRFDDLLGVYRALQTKHPTDSSLGYTPSKFEQQ